MVSMDDERTSGTMEGQADRLRRFQDGPPGEVISTLLNSIDNFFNNEIARAAEANCWSLMVMGVHAVALTISFGFFGLNGEAAYGRFLREYVDGTEPGADFSSIGNELHTWRNVLAHQWLGTAGHAIGFDPSIAVGWERRSGILVVNPDRYHQAYQNAFRTSSPLWKPEKLLTPAEIQAAKDRLIDKYVAR
jgi:hypothetical protein